MQEINNGSFKLNEIFYISSFIIFLWVAYNAVMLYVFPAEQYLIKHPEYSSLNVSYGQGAPQNTDRSNTYNFLIIINYNDLVSFECRESNCICKRNGKITNSARYALAGHHVTVKWHYGPATPKYINWFKPKGIKYAYEISDEQGVCYSYSEAIKIKGMTKNEADTINLSTKKSLLIGVVLFFLTFLSPMLLRMLKNT